MSEKLSDVGVGMLVARSYDEAQRAWNDLRAKLKAAETLLAQQAKRADEAEVREVSAQVRIVEMRRELDAARGELSMLRRRLEAK